MAAVASSWTPPPAAPVPLRARRALLALADDPPPAPLPPPPPTPSAAAPRPAPPPFLTQIGLGVAIFATVLAAALPLAIISEGLALAAAVGVGSVLVALLARRLCIALMIAALLAVLGAFAAAHSIHLSLGPPSQRQQLAELAPAAGLVTGRERAAAPPVALMLPVRAEIGGERVPVAGWAFPLALLAFWVVGFGAIAMNRALARWLWRRFARSTPKG